MHTRLKELRKTLGLTQAELANRIGIKQNTVATWESGLRIPSEALITSICREFAVSYNWLKNGVEPMKMPAKEADRYNIDRIMTGDNEFVKSVFRGMAALPPEAWEEIEKFVDRYLSKKDRS